MIEKNLISRRRFLRGIALAGAGAALAACAAPPAAQPPAPKAAEPTAAAPVAATAAPAAAAATEAPKATEAPAAPAAAGKTGEFHGAFPYQVPPTGHWNSFANDGISQGVAIYQDLLEMPMARLKWATGEYVPLMATKWGFDGENFTVTLRDGAKWSDDSAFSSKDVVDTFLIGRLFKWTIYNYVDKVEAKDATTVVFHMNKASTLVQRFVLTQHISASSVYGALAEKAARLVADGKKSDSDEWKALVKEATEFRPAALVVSGPFNIDPASITDASLSMNLNEKSWAAEKVNFGKVLLYNGETPAVTPLVLSGDIDYATHGFPPATEKEYISQGIRIIRAPTYGGPALYFNNDKAPFEKKEVRQAIAYSIKRDENGKVSLGDSGVSHKYMIGLSDNLTDKWIEKDALAKMNTYDYDLGKAEKLLETAGYKKGADGIYADSAGKALEFEISFPAEFADWSAAAENVTQQLNAAGFKVTARGVNFQQASKDRAAGAYTVTFGGWGAGNPHAYFAYQTPLFQNNYLESTTGKGMNFPMKQTYGGKEIDLQALIVDSAVGLDESKQKANISQVAAVFNELLPIVPLWERYGNNPALDKRVTGYPADGDPIYKNAVYGDNFVVMMILDGMLKPKA